MQMYFDAEGFFYNWVGLTFWHMFECLSSAFAVNVLSQIGHGTRFSSSDHWVASMEGAKTLSVLSELNFRWSTTGEVSPMVGDALE